MVSITQHISIEEARKSGLLSLPGKGMKSKSKGKNGSLSETEIQNQVRQYLAWKGWYVVRIQQSMGSHKGIADLVATKNGRTVWIEMKKPNGIQSKDQVDFQNEIESHGGKYMLARKIEDVQNL